MPVCLLVYEILMTCKFLGLSGVLATSGGHTAMSTGWFIFQYWVPVSVGYGITIALNAPFLPRDTML